MKKNISYHCQQLQEDNCKETIQGYDQLHPERKGNMRTYNANTYGRLDWRRKQNGRFVFTYIF